MFLHKKIFQEPDLQKEHKVIIYIKTNQKNHVVQLNVSVGVDMQYLLLCTAEQLQTQSQYTIQLQCAEMCHVMTRCGRNQLQYQIPLYETVYTLITRQKRSFNDRDFTYLMIIERDFPFQQKFSTESKNELMLHKSEAIRCLFETKNALSVLQTSNVQQQQNDDFFNISKDPIKNIENELRLTYPLPLLLPQSLLQKHYGRYMSEKNVWYQLRFGKKEAITPIVNQNKKKLPTYYMEIALRIPLMLSVFLVIQQILQRVLGIHHYYQSKSVIQRFHYIFILRIPLFPTLIKKAADAVLQIIFFYIFGLLQKRKVKEIVKYYFMLFAANFGTHLIFKCNSLLLTQNILVRIAQQNDPLGEHNTTYHLLFDELYRADNAECSYGGFHRGQKCRDFIKVNKEADLQVKLNHRFFGILIEFLKSFSPSYEVPK